MKKKNKKINKKKKMETTKQKIIVAIRKRPLSKKENNKNEKDIIKINPPNTLIVKELRLKVDLTKYIEEHNFNFDAVYDETITNEKLYKSLLQPLILNAFNKSKVSCFAYGQTGSGKTFTMMGDIKNNIPGLYLLAANDIFYLLKNGKYSHLIVGISFFEIYCGKAYDLLNDRDLCYIRVDAKENVNIVGLNEKIINNTESLMNLINYGMSVRITGQTGMNDNSSRSHAILQISLRDRDTRKMYGKMNFIDLAGSERGADVKDQDRQTRFDGAEINKSLLALKECIRALDMEKRHLPFRGSKLTLVLKDSFIGNCKTVMIGNISPSVGACEHTLNTLRYADRVKELKKGGSVSSKDKRRKTKKDRLAQTLLLPRMNKNSNIYKYKKNREYVNKRVSAPLYESSQFYQNTQLSKKILKPNNYLIKTNPLNSPLSPSPELTRNIKYKKMKSYGMEIENNQKSNFMEEEENSQNEEIDHNILERVSQHQDILIEEHSNHIDSLVKFVKEDMNFLQSVKDTPTEISEYISLTKVLLEKKINSIKKFQGKLDLFEKEFKNLEKVSFKEDEIFDGEIGLLDDLNN